MADDIVSQYYLANALRQGQRPSTRSLLAQRMMGNALDTSPTTPLGALARALTGVVSAYAIQNAEEGDRLDQKQALSALMDRDQQQQDEVPAWQARLSGQGAQPPAGGAAPAPAPVMRQALPDIGGPAQPGTPPPGGDLVPRIIQAEAGNQGPEGMAAVAHVIQNRARLTGMTPEQIVQQRGQFEPWGARRQEVLAMPPERFASAADVWRQVSGGQAPDPTGGATHFLNPDLLRQLGRPMPAWAPEGQGQRIGQHVFYSRPEDFRRVQVAGPGAPTEPAAPGGTVEASSPGAVQATLDALRQQQGAPAGGAPLSAAPAPAAGAPPVNMAVLTEGLASRNPYIRRAAEAQRDALQIQRQMETDRRSEAADRRADARAERQAALAERQAEQPFGGTGMDAQASNVLLRIGPRITNGTATEAERQQYALAYSHMTAPVQQQVPVDPNDPSRGMAFAWVPRQAPPGFPAPDFQPGAAGAPAAPSGQAAGPTPAAGAPPQAAPGGVQIVPGTGRPVEASDSERISAGYAARMLAAEQLLAQTQARGYQPGNISDAIASRIPGIGNFLTSEQGQLYRQAQEDWVRAKLRRESGAVIGVEEMAQEIRTYFPQPGDTPAMIEQKARARQVAAQGMVQASGRAQVTRPGPTGAPAPGPATHRFNPQTGQVEALN